MTATYSNNAIVLTQISPKQHAKSENFLTFLFFTQFFCRNNCFVVVFYKMCYCRFNSFLIHIVGQQKGGT